MARLATSEGGWFKLWGRKWLTDEKIGALSLSEQGAYVRLLCYANVLMYNGRFIDSLNNPITPEHISKAVKIEPAVFSLLVSKGFIQQEPGSSAYFVCSWEKHQTRVYKKSVEKPINTGVSMAKFPPPKERHDVVL
jgi:hypothetical protein